MSLEIFVRMLQTWTEFNDKIPDIINYHELMESLKANKDIKDLPHYVG